MFELRLVPGAAVDLRSAVAVLRLISDSALVNLSPEGLLMAADSPYPGNRFLALLHIPSTAEALLIFDAPSCFQLNLAVLLRHLNRAGDDDALHIRGGEGDDRIRFRTHNPETGQFGLWTHMPITAEFHEQMNLAEQNYEYTATIGIHSVEFVDHIKDLHLFGTYVSVYATDTEVGLYAVNRLWVENTEDERCFIHGVQHAHPVSFNFNIHFLSVILNACILTNDFVSFLYSENLNPVLFCPVRTIGNIRLYPDWPYNNNI